MNGIDHAELGKALCAHLKLPLMICDAVATHHRGATALAERCGQPLAQALDMAAALPHRLPHLNQTALQKLAARVRTNGASDESVDVIAVIRSTSTAYVEMLSRLGESDDASAAFKQFL